MRYSSSNAIGGTQGDTESGGAGGGAGVGEVMCMRAVRGQGGVKLSSRVEDGRRTRRHARFALDVGEGIMRGFLEAVDK